jgi:hypothetical protein
MDRFISCATIISTYLDEHIVQRSSLVDGVQMLFFSWRSGQGSMRGGYRYVDTNKVVVT